MRLIQQLPYCLLGVLLLASCSSSKHFSFQAVPYQRAIAKNETASLVKVHSDSLQREKMSIEQEIAVSSPVFTASSSTKAEHGIVLATNVHEKLKQAKLTLLKQENLQQVSNTRKMNIVERVVLKKVLKSAQKKAFFTSYSSYQDWNQNLKIGLILLAVGVALTILGLGQIGGLAALVGLIFLIIGLVSNL
jgi:hypothetical protein